MSRLNTFIVLLTMCLVLPACTDVKDELEIFKDDFDFDANDRTTDVTRENMEQLTLGTLQATYLPMMRLPLFDVLDAADFASITCLTGDATYSSNRASGEEYRRGDVVELSYSDCLRSDGATINGDVRLSYGLIRGLNPSFLKVNSQTCIAAVSEDLNIDPAELVENRDGSGELFLADSVRFKRTTLAGGRVGLQAEYLVLQAVEGSDNQEFRVVDTRDLDEKSIVVLRAVEQDPDRSTQEQTFYRLKSGGYPSLDGDQIFATNGEEFDEQLCQQYDRQMSVAATNFSIAPGDDTQITLNGSLSIFEATRDFESFSQSIRDSAYQIEFIQGERRSRYSLEDLRIDVEKSESEQTFNFTVTGQASSSELFGTVELITEIVLRSRLNDLLPLQGNIDILGRELEKVDAVFNGVAVEVRADVDGDTDGDGQSDLDTFLDTFWQDLLDRNFVFGPAES